MSNGVLRTRKDGRGCSICHAKPENVGKKKCCHIMDGANMTVKKINGTNFVNIDGKMNGEQTKISIEANEKKIKSYISNLSKALNKKEKDNILNALRDNI